MIGDVAAHRVGEAGARLRRLARRCGAAPRRRASPTTRPTRSAAGAPRRARCARRIARRGCATRSRGSTSGSSGLLRLLRLARILAVGLRFRLHDLAPQSPDTRAAAAARGARDPRPDLRQVRPGALDAARPRCRSTSPTSSRSCRTACRRFRPSWRWPKWSARWANRSSEAVRSFRRTTRGERLHRPGAPRATARRHRGRGQGAAAGRREGDRARPRAARHRGRAGRALLGRRPAPEAASRWWRSSRATSTTSSI